MALHKEQGKCILVPSFQVENGEISVHKEQFTTLTVRFQHICNGLELHLAKLLSPHSWTSVGTDNIDAISVRSTGRGEPLANSLFSLAMIWLAIDLQA